MGNNFYESREFLFTSESVSHGHPDKICDQISDAILDAYLAKDPYSRVAVETLATTNRVVVAGEVRGSEDVANNIEQIVRDTVKDIGYEQNGFDWQTLEVTNLIHSQSPDIAQGVDSIKPELEGAGDQGLMFGYACDETPELMPAPLYYSHLILRNIFEAGFTELGPDAKSQVTMKYIGNKPVSAKSVVLSIQHPEGMSNQEIHDKVYPIIVKTLGHEPEEFFLNPTGKFVIGGPDGDAGLTGRKIIVDTYGGAAPHGGGAFSGKDPTKVDRSAAYMARYIAKNIVASGVAKACTIQLAYAIGVVKPISLYVNTHGTSSVDENKISDAIEKLIDLTPWGLREHLQLHRPIYYPSASYGHFGRQPRDNGAFSWEKTDIADKLKEVLLCQ